MPRRNRRATALTFGGLIETLAGLVVVYFLLSVLASGLSEALESLVRRRPRYLEAGIFDLLGTRIHEFYDHPLVETLHPDRGRPRRVPGKGQVPATPKKRGKQKPSYIPSRIFSAAILSLLTDRRTTLREPGAGAAARGPLTPGPLTRVEAVAEVERNVAALPEGPLKRSVEAFLASSGHDYDELRAELERWYDDKMDRVSGWYKRRTRMVLFIWGIVIAGAFNADTIVLARTLYTSSTLRAGMAVAAQPCLAAAVPSAPASPAPTTPPVPSGSLQCVVDQMGSVRALGLPLGWNRDGPAWPEGTRALVLKVLGLLVTAGALTLGAPFWFDLLNKFVNVRATGQPPAKHGEPSRATQPPPGAGEAGTTRG